MCQLQESVLFDRKQKSRSVGLYCSGFHFFTAIGTFHNRHLRTELCQVSYSDLVSKRKSRSTQSSFQFKQAVDFSVESAGKHQFEEYLFSRTQFVDEIYRCKTVLFYESDPKSADYTADIVYAVEPGDADIS